MTYIVSGGALNSKVYPLTQDSSVFMDEEQQSLRQGNAPVCVCVASADSVVAIV